MDGLEGKIPIKNMMIILGTPISGNLHISKETTMLHTEVEEKAIITNNLLFDFSAGHNNDWHASKTIERCMKWHNAFTPRFS